MLSILRSALYRSTKSASTWGFTIIMILCACATSLMIWLVNNYWFGADTSLSDSAAAASILETFGDSFLSNALVVMITAVYMAVFVAGDYQSGYIKNLIQIDYGRVSYVAAMALMSLVAAAWFVIVGIIVMCIALIPVGQAYFIPSIFNVIIWLIQTVLVIGAYSTITLLVVFATKSQTVGVLAGIIIGGGFIEMILNLIVTNVPGMPGVIQTCVGSFLSLALQELATSAFNIHALLVGLLTFVVVTAIAVVVMKKRTVA